MSKDTQIDFTDTETVEIVQRPAIAWFSLRLMIRTGIQALLSNLVGARTARREVLAALDLATCGALPETRLWDASHPVKGTEEPEALWLDYIADLGDGFNATYSMAWLLGRDFLRLDNPQQQVKQPLPKDAFSEVPAQGSATARYLLPAGSITIFGGDQVYPFATQQNYAERTIGPYYAARPWQNPEEKHGGRRLFTIPGNHDWYDGLNSFVKNFSQPGRWIGCWQVAQKRSYFSVRLGHGFWLWGVDLATGDEFDAPQLEYFTECAKNLGENDQVVLCVPKPAWITQEEDLQKQNSATADKKSWESWSKIETVKKIIDRESNGLATVPLMIAGDHHHYAHHQTRLPVSSQNRHYITCGGGGAFLLGTCAVPKTLTLGKGLTVHEDGLFPSRKVSKSLRKNVFKLFYTHKLFCIALAMVLLTLVWLLQSVSQTAFFLSLATGKATVASSPSLLDAFGNIGPPHWNISGFLGLLVSTLTQRPSVVLLLLGIMGGFIAFSESGRAPGQKIWVSIVAGSLHFLVQLFFAFLIVHWVWDLLEQFTLPEAIRLTGLFVFSVTLGWILCGLTFSTYIRLSNLLVGQHEQEIYSSQSIEDWKSFLRMKIDRDKLTIYPIGLRRVARDWSPLSMRQGSGSFENLPKKARSVLDRIRGIRTRFNVPKGATRLFDPVTPLEIELIEGPIEIPVKKGVSL